MGGGSNLIGSSSNRRSKGSCWRRTTRSSHEQLLDRCGCGSQPVLKWSGTEANPGRPFYGCPNCNVGSQTSIGSKRDKITILASILGSQLPTGNKREKTIIPCLYLRGIILNQEQVGRTTPLHLSWELKP
ncbi:hypothetical protein Ahy_B10g105724 [Arachis hypogaea]|uniref:Zinc finger GRF-type domain-containing protein n=1 Tax=Arachis hypogaea TaxID=3818 RepID=A0A444X8P8_ARAHY|nr:hypothetical protein Ahy_B10g105724 [Arachis hypogaea]